MSGEKTLEFRYTKKEQFLGIGWLIAFLFFIGLGACIPFIVKRQTPGDIYAMVTWFSICFIGILYSINLWLRRHSFVITVDSIGLRISRFDKTQKINWESVKSYTYQCGHPYWFLSLHLTNGKRINLHGELENFDELIGLVRGGIKNDLREFRYTVRKRIDIIIVIFCISSASIMIIWSLIDWFFGRMPWVELLGFILFALLLYGYILSIQLYRSQIKIFVSDNGLIMKPWLVRRKVFISWLEIRDFSQIELGTHQATIAARIPKITIRVRNNSIYFCEDLDNVDELINIIEDKTGIKLNL